MILNIQGPFWYQDAGKYPYIRARNDNAWDDSHVQPTEGSSVLSKPENETRTLAGRVSHHSAPGPWGLSDAFHTIRRFLPIIILEIQVTKTPGYLHTAIRADSKERSHHLRNWVCVTLFKKPHRRMMIETKAVTAQQLPLSRRLNRHAQGSGGLIWRGIQATQAEHFKTRPRYGNQDAFIHSTNRSVDREMSKQLPPPGSKEWKTAEKKRKKNAKRNERIQQRRMQGPRYPYALHVRAGTEPISLAEWRTILVQASTKIWQLVKQHYEDGRDVADYMAEEIKFVEEVPPENRGKKTAKLPAEQRMGHGLCLFMKHTAKHLYRQAFGITEYQREGKLYKSTVQTPVQDVRAMYNMRILKALWPALGEHLMETLRWGNKHLPEDDGFKVVKGFQLVDSEYVIIVFAANKAWENALDSHNQRLVTPFGPMKLRKKCRGRPQELQDEAAKHQMETDAPPNGDGDNEMETQGDQPPVIHNINQLTPDQLMVPPPTPQQQIAAAGGKPLVQAARFQNTK